MNKADVRFARYILMITGMGWLSACAPKAAMKPVAINDFSHIHRISVAKFEGDEEAAVSNEFIRMLIGNGFNVVNRTNGMDAVLSGSVAEYKPTKELMVFLGNTPMLTSGGGQSVVVSNPLVSPGSTQVTPQGTSPGLANTEIGSVYASVDVIARLTDRSTGHIVWADEYSYEALDIQTALQAVVGRLVSSLQRGIPNTPHPSADTGKS